ncbi:toll/interleukin-1 receptor domain-containing adapter protein [Dendrobates tinctorius]|uniref:toll/interleukin-1 receptor domain-containing adapter protein n=1 Tax=Dendrobates tinctorius TaxID=92724 RepID=UPI003CC9BA91
MGSRESKLKSSPRIPTSLDHGSRIRTVTSRHSMPMQPVQSTNPAPIPVWPDGSVRWQSQYDVYICHSEADVSYAMEMLSYLEQQPEKLRCFLPMRDMQAGGPIPSEMCSGLESSHCWVMLLTPQFLSDNWCKYQMHQFLAQAPCSNGRLIPVIIGLTFAQYPSVVKHMYAIKGTFNDPSVFSKVKEAIVTYLKEITMTSEQIPAYLPRSQTPEGSSSTSNPLGNSLLESLVNQEPTSDRTIMSPVTQDPTSQRTIWSSVTYEAINDRTIRSPQTQEPTSVRTIRSSLTQEPTSVSTIRSSLTQEPTSDRTIRNTVTQKTTSERIFESAMIQEPISERTIMSSLTHEPTSDMSVNGSVTTQEITSDMSMSGSIIGQETTSDMSMCGSMNGQEKTSDMSVSGFMTGQETTGDAYMSGSMARQDTISDVSFIDSMMGHQPPCWLQDPHSDISTSLVSRAVLTDCELFTTATKDLSQQETRQDTSDSGVWSMSRDLVTLQRL